jgi:hypothetical protein
LRAEVRERDGLAVRIDELERGSLLACFARPIVNFWPALVPRDAATPRVEVLTA